jgi:hypothetical protein
MLQQLKDILLTGGEVSFPYKTDDMDKVMYYSIALRRGKIRVRTDKEELFDINEFDDVVNNFYNLVSKTKIFSVTVSNIESAFIKTFKYKLYRNVVSLFDHKNYNDKTWKQTYDRLIRIDGYSEERILQIVTNMRKDEFWGKGNFESLIKLRKKNNEGVKYVDIFDKKTPVKEQLKKPKIKYFGEEELNEKLK